MYSTAASLIHIYIYYIYVLYIVYTYIVIYATCTVYVYTIYYTYNACIQSGSAIMDHTSCAMNLCIATL